MYVIEFELSNTRYKDNSTPYIIVYPDSIPEEVAASLNRLHDHNDLLLSEEAEARDIDIKNKISNLNEMIDPILAKYDVIGRVVPHTDRSNLGHKSVIYLDWDIDDVSGCAYREDYLTYRQHSLFFSGFYFNGDPANWYVNKSDDENLKFIENAIAQSVAAVKNWMETVDYVLDNLHDIEDRVISQLSRFEYDGVAIDDIDIETHITDGAYRYNSGPQIDDSIIISFRVYGYGGKIDLDIKYTWGEWNSMDVNKKLINIIKYRKRKYGLA